MVNSGKVSYLSGLQNGVFAAKGHIGVGGRGLGAAQPPPT